ncbi:hypothetical protein EB796_016726 [Bugula neritina]|uniref:Uncharacterized protein n=1 Tax=Bugula neritina TaxID=10212 RepID=A0A7J7JHB6_BUGNE|nr:hypothetical protein EB796_016726 [Bugula neritina]
MDRYSRLSANNIYTVYRLSKFNTRKCRSIRDSRALSVNSLLSRVAEDDEYIFDEDLSPLEEAEDFDYSSFGDDRISTISEGEEDSASSVSEDSVEKKEALVFTNFLKASLIVSGGEGLIHMHNEIEASDESTLIMWQQNQMWT